MNMRKIIFISIVTLLLFMCKKQENYEPSDLFSVNPSYSPYIAAFTTGLISNQSDVKIILHEEIKDSTIIQNPSLFTFKPTVEGSVSIEKGNTLVFKPSKPFAHDQLYEAAFDLQQVNKEVTDSLAVFPFNFQTLKQNFDIEITSVQSLTNQTDTYEVKGIVLSNDFIENADLEKLFQSRFHDKELTPRWSHQGNQHQFTFTSITRNTIDKELQLTIKASEIGFEEDITEKITIPKKGEFKLIKVKAYSHPEQYITAVFSEPVKNRDFSGMFNLEGENFKSILLEGNIVKLYPAKDLTGKYKFTVWEGLEDIYNNKMSSYTEEITLNSLYPKVEFVGNGNIVTQTVGVHVPFRAIGLNAVDVKITKIFNNNIHQFFKSNEYDETSNLRLIGRETYTTTLNLAQQENFNAEQLKVYSLNIAKIVKQDPTAMYNIELSFKRKYSLLNCNENLEKNESAIDLTNDDDWDKNTDLYRYYDYDYYPDNYNWKERDNPCDDSYYTRNKFVDKNVLASNIGITAKIGADRKMHVALANLLDIATISDAEITAYDLQNQVVGQAQTDGKGFAAFDLKRKPFLIKAAKDNEVAYLRVDEGAVLNYSNFDIEGTKLTKGIDGFIYGERGVWRPGDSIFLTFVPHAANKKLPDNIPAVFKLYNTDNQLIDSKVISSKGDHFHVFKTKTNPSDKTGNYSLNVQYAGVNFYKTIKVETIKPNRLKIALDFPSEVLTSNSSPVSVQSNWLTGSEASGLKLVTEATFQNVPTTFKGYKDYIFDDPIKSVSSDSKVIFDGYLDENGYTQIPNNWQPKNEVPGMLSVGFFSKVFEKGGDFSTSYVSHLYSPYTEYVGFKIPYSNSYYEMLETDQNNTIPIVTLDKDGKPVNSVVEVSVYKTTRSWWYNSNDEDLAYFVNENHKAKVQSHIVQTNGGKGTFTLRIDHEDWGNYFIRLKDLKSGHTSGQSVWIDWSDWQSRKDGNQESAALMVINSNKEKYEVGDEAVISIPNAMEGKALLSLESGSTIIRQEWVETQAGTTKITVPITKEMAPNVYVNVSMIQPHQNTTNDLPIRMYGVKNLQVEDRNLLLQPKIKTASEIEPNSDYTVKVSEKDGKAMTYTLAVVDEGLLDLTQFKTPDIYNYFNHKQSLGVKTWDIYQYVLGAYGGRIESVFAIGGDQALQQNNKEKINRFKPVVTFLGPFSLSAKETQTHTVKMPNYIGSVKVMVVAANSYAFGSAEQNITVKKPLMTLTSLPRTLTPGDEVTLPVSIFTGKDDIKTVKVNLSTNDKIELISSAAQEVSFDQKGDKIVEYKLKVPYKLGKATLKLNAQSGNYTAYEEIEVEVRAPNPSLSDTQFKELTSGSTQFSVTPKGMDGTNTTVVELSSLPISNFVSRMDYLIQYPHGCLEQTVSSMFPQLYLNDLTHLSQSQIEKTQRNIEYGIELLKRFQVESGGMSYWPGSSYESNWGSVYAMHFLVEAEAKGYQVPDHLKRNLLNYLSTRSKQWDYYRNKHHYYKENQAYTLYVLALAKNPNISEMNRLKEASLNNTTIYLLANAYYQIGKKEMAKKMYERANTQVENYHFNYYTYGSSLRDQALMLMCLSDMKDQQKSYALLKDISKNLNNNSWYSTQTTAMSLVAISKYLQGKVSKNVGVDAVLTVNGKAQKVQTTNDFYTIEFKNDEPLTIDLDNKQSGVLFASVTRKGIPAEIVQEAKASDLIMKVEYKDGEGKLLDVKKLPQNTDFEAHVTITNPGARGRYHDLALTQLFPSGWEIVNMRIYSEETHSASGIEYQDYRDDRVMSYFDLDTKESVTVKILLNATYKGTYRLPSVQCEAMYDNTIFAYNKGEKVTVY